MAAPKENQQTLDQLNQSNLGDKKLSREEISYIQWKDQLWFKDIGDKLFDDIVTTNENLLKNNGNLKAYIDDIILQPETLRQIAQKSGISLGKAEKLFSDANQNLDNKTNKYYMVVNLLLYWCTKDTFPEVRWNLIDNINTPAFTAATAKALHRFQKIWEKTQGWSKADCILWPKTIQQMLSKLWVNTVNKKVDVMTFAQSNISSKDKYEWNGEQWKQMETIAKDPALTDEQKVEKLWQVANKTVDVWSDKLNKKYGAVSYMCQLIANNIIVNKSAEDKEKILTAVTPYAKLIKKYWNEKSAVEYGVDPKLVPKTNDFVADIKKMAEATEAKYQWNAIMVNTAIQLSNAWVDYYQKENPKWRKKRADLIQWWLKDLQRLYDNKTPGDIRAQVAAAMDKIFFDTASSSVDEEIQKWKFALIKELFMTKWNWTNRDDKMYVVNNVLQHFRTIDEQFDWDMDFWLFRLGSFKSTDGIKNAIEEQHMSEFTFDAKNAPQEFRDEQNAIKAWSQKIKDAMEKDPTWIVAQKVDQLLTAIKSNDAAKIRTLIQDVDLFGTGIKNETFTDKSIKDIVDRMKNLSDQNDKNKENVLWDLKKNYNKVFEQMKWTIMWLREQGRGDEADKIENNKSAYETLVNGWAVTNPPVWMEQFAGKTLADIANEEIHKMERAQLTWVLETWLMRWLMRKNEDMLKKLSNQWWIWAEEELTKLYADMEWFDGSFSDATVNTISAVMAEILITIAVSILTAGVGGIIMNSALKIAQWVFKVVKWGSMAAKIARFWELGNTTLRTIRMAQGISRATKAAQITAKVLFRSTALLAEAPVFNSVSKIIHNEIQWNAVFAWIDLNPTAIENIKTAAFLWVMHGFSTLKNGMVSINFGKAGEIFAKSPEFIKSAWSMGSEFTTMMASEQVMNLTFGREVIDPATWKMTIERWQLKDDYICQTRKTSLR